MVYVRAPHQFRLGSRLIGAGRFVRFSAISGAYWRLSFACWQT